MDLRCARTVPIKLSNRYQLLQDLQKESELDLETERQQAKKMWIDTCEDALGKQRMHHKDWISPETIGKLHGCKEKKSVVNNSRTRAEKSKAREQYSKAHKAVGRNIRTDKRNLADDLARRAQEAARNCTASTNSKSKQSRTCKEIPLVQ